jgi:DNA-binding transcriptional ArsR family regulator
MSGAATVLKNPEISREALRVLGVLLEHVTWENRARIKVKEIAEALGIAAPHASRGLMVLRDQGIVTLIQQGEYEVHPEVLHVGTLEGAKHRKKRRVARDLAQALEHHEGDR